MKALLLAALLLFPVALLAQEDDDAEPSDAPVIARISTDVRMHDAPAGAPIATLASGAEVRVIGISPDGWVRVLADEQKGWVDRHFIDVPMSPSRFARKGSKPAPPCHTPLSACPSNGCPDEKSPHGIVNRAKHGPPKGDLTQLTMKTFTALQKAADKVVGQAAELDAADRESIHDLRIGDDTLGEGHLVRISGFIVGKPHPNTKESVNCNLKSEENNDIHINIAPAASKTEFDGIVVEMIPQDRNEGWTSVALNKVAKAKKRVLVTGQLFYDNLHRVNGDSSNPLEGQPKRFSLWEVHPITKFLVCTKAPCDVNNPAQWTKLEDMP